MTKSLRILLANLIDYAGLFPPAALTMQDAVRNYAAYRDGELAWILGKFVVPEARAKEVPPEFPMSVLGIDEVKFADIDGAAPDAFIEISDLAQLDEIARRGLKAKIRTGGVTTDAFPPIENVAAFLRACKARNIEFKATAGLHHPLRCVKALTYEPNAPVGTMHGFLNVFLAAAMLDDAEAILGEHDARAFTFDDEGATWRGRRASLADLAEMRRFAISFGSCSFEEPVGDLQELGWL